MVEPNFLSLFFLTVLLISIGSLLYYKFDVLEPGVLMSAAMAFSAFMAFLNINRWSLPFSFEAWFLLTAAIVLFQFGSFCSYKIGFQNAKTQSSNSNVRYEPSQWMTIICCIGIIGMAIFSFRELYDLSLSLGNVGGITSIIKVVRPAIEKQIISLSRWMNYRQSLALAIASIYSFMLLFNVFYSKLKLKDLSLLIPIVLYFPFMIMTTGRMAMMSFGIYLFVVGMVLYQKKYGYTIRCNQKAILFLAVAAIAFIGMFLLMGFFTGKIASENHTVSMILAHYAGVSLPAFDKAIHTVYSDNGFVGSTTFLGIYRVLGRIGLTVPQVDIFLPFVKFDGIDTNVYTAEWRYYKDFGFVGLCAIMWLLGAFYSLFYNKIKYDTVSPFLIIFYASIAFPLFLSSIDERFFLDLFGTAILYQFVLLFILYKFIICTSVRSTELHN